MNKLDLLSSVLAAKGHGTWPYFRDACYRLLGPSIRPEPVAELLSVATRIEIAWDDGKKWQACYPGLIHSTASRHDQYIIFGTISERMLKSIEASSFSLKCLPVWRLDQYEDLYLTRYALTSPPYSDDEFELKLRELKLDAYPVGTTEELMERIPTLPELLSGYTEEALPRRMADVFKPTALRWTPLDWTENVGPCVIRYRDPIRFAYSTHTLSRGIFCGPSLALAAACATSMILRYTASEEFLEVFPWRSVRYVPALYKRLLYLNGVDSCIEGKYLDIQPALVDWLNESMSPRSGLKDQ